MLNDLLCTKHGTHKECMGGCNAHRSNWYCPECEAEALEFGRKAVDAQKMNIESERPQLFDYTLTEKGESKEVSHEFYFVDANPWYLKITNALGLTSVTNMKAVYLDEELNRMINSL